MKDKLKILLQHITAFDKEALDKIVACFQPRSVRRNTLLLREGEVCKEFYYVHTGCLRTFFIDKNGHEKTRYVMPDCSIGTALTSFISFTPSFEYIDALDETEILAISRQHFFHLHKKMEQWKIFYQKILGMAYSFQNKKIETLVTLTATQRYEKIIIENPVLIQKLSNKVLASYLDIREETLSRLKSKRRIFLT